MENRDVAVPCVVERCGFGGSKENETACSWLVTRSSVVQLNSAEYWFGCYYLSDLSSLSLWA